MTLLLTFLLFSWRKRVTVHKNCSYFKVTCTRIQNLYLVYYNVNGCCRNTCKLNPIHGYPDSYSYQCERGLTGLFWCWCWVSLKIATEIYRDASAQQLRPGWMLLVSASHSCKISKRGLSLLFLNRYSQLQNGSVWRWFCFNCYFYFYLLVTTLTVMFWVVYIDSSSDVTDWIHSSLTVSAVDDVSVIHLIAVIDCWQREIYHTLRNVVIQCNPSYVRLVFLQCCDRKASSG